MKLKKITAALLAALTLITFSSCKSAETLDLFAMDTVMSLSAYGRGAAKALEQAEEKIKELDSLFSVTDSQSEISLINAADGYVKVSEDTKKLIARAKEISLMTDDTFDITVRPVSKLWGFTEEEHRVPSQSELEKALKQVGSDSVYISDGRVRCDGEIDLGGIAKGYTAECIRKILTDNGVEHAVISLGGNVLLQGTRTDGKPWRVGITHPLDSENIIGILEAEDTAVVTSGGYERNFTLNGEVYHHIIDPKTGYPADSGIISSTVITKDDTLADALSTALYVMGAEKAAEFWQNNGGFEMILITDHEIFITDGIADSFELKDEKFEIIKLDK